MSRWQAWPQPPQLLASVSVLIVHPAVPPQLSQPAYHQLAQGETKSSTALLAALQVAAVQDVALGACLQTYGSRHPPAAQRQRNWPLPWSWHSWFWLASHAATPPAALPHLRRCAKVPRISAKQACHIGLQIQSASNACTRFAQTVSRGPPNLHLLQLTCSTGKCRCRCCTWRKDRSCSSLLWDCGTPVCCLMCRGMCLLRLSWADKGVTRQAAGLCGNACSKSHCPISADWHGTVHCMQGTQASLTDCTQPSLRSTHDVLAAQP